MCFWRSLRNTLTPGGQRFYKLKKECEQLKTAYGAARHSMPNAKANGAAKEPGTGRGRERKDAAADDGEPPSKKQKIKPELEPEDDDDDEKV